MDLTRQLIAADLLDAVLRASSQRRLPVATHEARRGSRAQGRVSRVDMCQSIYQGIVEYKCLIRLALDKTDRKHLGSFSRPRFRP
jgi:hypothetical protein